MDQEGQQKKGSQPFFTTLPGILTGLATFITAVAGLIVALFSTGVLPLDDEGTTTTSTSSPVELYPNPTERILLNHIPANVKDSGCRRAVGEEAEEGAVASIRCFSDDAEQVQYHQYSDRPTMDDIYLERVAAARSFQAPLDNSECGPESPAGEGTYRDANGQVVGRLLCYQVEQESWYEWKHDGLLIFSDLYLNGLDSAATFEAWTTAGPR